MIHAAPAMCASLSVCVHLGVWLRARVCERERGGRKGALSINNILEYQKKLRQAGTPEYSYSCTSVRA